MMENTEIIKALRECEYCDVCSIAVDGDCPFGGRNALEVAAADELEEYMKKENALRSLIDGRSDPVSCNVDAILMGEYE